MPSTVVIVGNGHAGLHTAVSLRDGGFDGRLVLIGDEPDLPYQRPPLSKAYLDEAADASSLAFRNAGFYGSQRIELLTGSRVTAIDRSARRVRVGDGDLAYDHLVLATGARDRPLPIPGGDLDGVFRLRTRADADRLRPRLYAAGDIVIIGAGFIGLEFAAVATKRGARVHVIELARRPMARAVTPEMSEFFHAAHAATGTRMRFGASVARLHGPSGRVTAVETTDGLILPADLVLAGIGVLPNVELASAAGLDVGNGIAVDGTLLTSDPAISAIGDCALFPCAFAAGDPVRLESVQNAVDQARCVASRLLGRPSPYRAVPWFWSEQGKLRLQIAGLALGHDTIALRGTMEGGSFSLFAFKAGRLIAVESVNRPADHMIGRKLLAEAAPITPAQAADGDFDLRAALTTVRPAG